MTLIISIATPDFVLQAGDRLITRVWTNGQVTEFDATSNKNVLYEASDGILSVSFSGNAYIDGLPTDEWIATILNQDTLPVGPDEINPPAISHRNAPYARPLSVNSVIGRLRSSMNDIKAETIKAMSLFIAVSGWMYRYGTSTPVLIELERTSSNSGTKVSGCKRVYWRTRKHRLAMSLIGSGNTPQRQSILQNAIKDIHQVIPSSLENWNKYVTSLFELPARLIQDAATVDPTVGPNVHLVVMPRANDNCQLAETHFFAKTEHIVPPPTMSIVPVAPVDAAVTSWFIGANQILAPAYLVGDLLNVVSTRRIRVDMYGAKPQQGVLFRHRALQRVRLNTK
ncbi:hypothetical protein [Burkholderia ubonensis]|uniref:hypothetical protein n=1 Tax=Burkholderia ubonensis TaxID=101571 RepID=UPI0012FBFA38|nr:hypothetical protein [Burkholderia ubonensis]